MSSCTWSPANMLCPGCGRYAGPLRADLTLILGPPPITGPGHKARESAWRALAERVKKRIDTLQAEHSIFVSRAKHRIIEGRTSYVPASASQSRPHPPGSGRKALYLASHASHIVGKPFLGRMLIRELMEHATRPQFVHTHKWVHGDLVIWDNDASRRPLRRSPSPPRYASGHRAGSRSSRPGSARSIGIGSQHEDIAIATGVDMAKLVAANEVGQLTGVRGQMLRQR